MKRKKAVKRARARKKKGGDHDLLALLAFLFAAAMINYFVQQIAKKETIRN